MKPREAFLSHSDRDRKFADRLSKTLVSHGIQIFYSRRHLRGAQQWHDEIGAALARCDWFLLVLSPRSVRSEWVKRELLYALDSPAYQGHIVPILLRDCEAERLSWTLGQFQRVDFKQGFDAGCRDLFRVWQLRYQVPQ